MINREHPDFNNYISECNVLLERFKKELQILEAKELEHSKDGECSTLAKQFNLDIKKVQDKYSYLFTE